VPFAVRSRTNALPYGLLNTIPSRQKKAEDKVQCCCKDQCYSTQITLGRTRTCDPRIRSSRRRVRAIGTATLRPLVPGVRFKARRTLGLCAPVAHPLQPLLFSKGMFESEAVASAGRTRPRPNRGGAQLARLPEALLRTHLWSLGSEKVLRPAVRDSPRL
jgi:hypothetical protein